jgi:Papain family cysteine protease
MKGKHTTVLLVFCHSLSLAQGFKADQQQYDTLPAKPQSYAPENKALPTKVDLSAFAPEVMNQGSNSGTCVGMATAYMRTILEAKRLGISEKEEIEKIKFSPSYIYNLIKDSTISECKEGTDIGMALRIMKTHDIARFTEQGYPHCGKNVTIKPNPASRILDFVKVFSLNYREEDIRLTTQKALAEGSPVVIGLQLTPVLAKFNRWDRLWNQILQFFGFENELGLWKPKHSKSLGTGHAVCLVGYDNQKFGGAFCAINSYGKDWGDNGYFWIKYTDYTTYVKYAYQAFVADNQLEIAMSADVILAFPENPDRQIAFHKTVQGNSTASPQTIYALKDPQKTCTAFRFSSIVSQQTYLYVLAFNESAQFTNILFPRADSVSALLGQYSQIYLPKRDSVYILEPPVGLEQLMFLFSKESLPIQQVVHEINQKQGEWYANVHAVLGEKMVPSNQIEYKSERLKKVGFFLKKAHKGSVVPVLVTVNHIENKEPCPNQKMAL